VVERNCSPDIERMTVEQPRQQLLGSVREIDASARRMRLWIDELVDVARLQIGQELHLHCAPTDLANCRHGHWPGTAHRGATLWHHQCRHAGRSG
jgi:hypothetical protein